MQLNHLPKSTHRSKKRVGRGYGSGKGGHTSGRGAKGQHARNSVAIWFEGGQLPLIKRLPFQRGKGRFNSLTDKPITITLGKLNTLPPGTIVTSETLVKHGLVAAKAISKRGIKILSGGKLEKTLKVSLPTSKSAATAITKAGGSLAHSHS